MGVCHSKKKEVKANKPTINKEEVKTPGDLTPFNEEQKTTQINDLPPPVNIVEEVQIVAVDRKQSIFMEACYQGNEQIVQEMIKNNLIDDIASYKGGQNNSITVGNKTYDTATWNPLLLSIALKHVGIVKMFYHQVSSFHRINCMSKPQQKKTIIDNSSQIKRECFGLKLAILNQDQEMLKFLWNDLRIYWNLGHFYICLKYMTSWEAGLKILLGSTTSKVIFMSINTSAADFVDVVDLLQGIISKESDFTIRLKEGFLARPYFILSYFIQLSSENQPDVKMLESTLKEITQDDLQLSFKQIGQLFDIVIAESKFKEIVITQKGLFMGKFINRDADIQALKIQLSVFLAAKNEESILDTLDELDLFAFTEIEVNGKKTNALIQALSLGLQSIVDYAFNDGFINLRAVLKTNNVFEIENEVSNFNLSFFTPVMNDKYSRKLYYNLIDLLQLSDFPEIFKSSNDEFADFVLGQARFKSLFISSLENQKLAFIVKLKDRELIEKLDPYREYLNQLNKSEIQQQVPSKTKLLVSKKVIFQDNVLEQSENNLQQKQNNLQVQERNKDVITDEQYAYSPAPTISTYRSPASEVIPTTQTANLTPIIIKEVSKQQQHSMSLERKLSEVIESQEDDDTLNLITHKDEEDQDEDDHMNISHRMPQSTSLLMIQKWKEESMAMQPIIKQKRHLSIDRVHSLIVEAIKDNNINKVKALIKQYSIRNVACVKSYDATQLQVRDFSSKSIDKNLDSSVVNQFYDTSLWNPVLFAIYFQRIDILKCLMDEYVANFILAIRLPPVNEYSEYIIPNQRTNEQQWALRTSRNLKNLAQALRVNQSPTTGPPMSPRIDNFFTQNDLLEDAIIEDDEDLIIANNPATYNPSQARVECFGIELAIRNQDLSTFKYLWNDFNDRWEERHFAFILDKMLQENWDVGLGMVFRAKTSHVIFRSLSPEDKDNFLFSKIVDKITDIDYWENDALSPLKITQQQVQIVISELSYDPYGSYAVLKFPQLFLKSNLLESTLKKVNFDDIYDFVLARKENAQHLLDFISKFESQTHNHNSANEVARISHEKTTLILAGIAKNATKIKSQAVQLATNRQKEQDIEPLIQQIKLGDCNSMVKIIEEGGLERLNLLTGFEDKDYLTTFQANIQYIPTDEIMRLLITDSTTTDWNPLIFAIFYQRLDIVTYFCNNPLVYVRSCLVKPFLLEAEDEDNIEVEGDEDEKYISEKSELFCLVLCIMLQNREIFRYLLKRCAFLWNDVHLALLTNYLLEAQWADGLKALMISPGTHQIFNQMNLYEKEKYLKFCEKSVCKSIGGTSKSSLVSDFRYQMSFDPYNAYYLPIVASVEDLSFWDQMVSDSEDSVSKELFLKTCLLNFDEKSCQILNKYNSQYINQFISVLQQQGPPRRVSTLDNFAFKLKRLTEAIKSY